MLLFLIQHPFSSLCEFHITFILDPLRLQLHKKQFMDGWITCQTLTLVLYIDLMRSDNVNTFSFLWSTDCKKKITNIKSVWFVPKQSLDLNASLNLVPYVKALLFACRHLGSYSYSYLSSYVIIIITFIMIKSHV